MIKHYKFTNNRIVSCPEAEYSVRVFIAPDEEEISLLRTEYEIDEHTLSSATDPEEEPRFELKEDHSIIVWKCPRSFKLKGSSKFDVMSMAVFMFNDKMEFVISEDTNLFNNKMMTNIATQRDFLLLVLSKTISNFQSHLKTINMVSKEIKEKVNTSLDNTYLLQMFDLGESLIYYYNAISSNGAVLEKIRHNARKIGFTPDEIETISDVQVDNNQCCKQAEILSSILAGLMDARGTVVNNNANNLLRKLTLINTIFLPLNLIASMGGMSEYTAFTSNIGWKLAYLLFIVFMIFAALFTFFLLEPPKFKFKLKPRRRRRRTISKG